MRKCFFNMVLLWCCMQCEQLCAQDPHFSQYFSSPLTFNPAMTGYFEGTSRFALNFRNQWANVTDPYTTGTISFDTRIMRNSIAANDKWGLGVMALYDQSAGGIYKNSYLSLSTAFNKGLDADGGQSIGIGVQAAFARNNIDFSRITYSNQFAGSGYNPTIPSGEPVNNNSVSYIDLNAGVLYNYRDEKDNQFSVGASVYHILHPSLSYFSNNNAPLPRRLTMHAGASMPLGERDQLFFSGHLMYQSGANETVIGGAYGIGIGGTEGYLYLGAWLRAKDAVYPYMGLQTPSWQLGLSYDITTSDLKTTKGFSGSSELSFVYFFNRNTTKGIPCFF